MPVRFYNTLTGQIDDFTPLKPPAVSIYSCGPTVYDYAHIGNFRSFLFADVLRRFLELVGHDVRHVMNITDVGHMTDDHLADGGGEDKMAVAGQRLKEDKKSGKVVQGAVENPDDPYQVADYYTRSFLSDARKLGMKVAFEGEAEKNIRKATDCIPQMQAMIGKLLERGHAYIAEDGAVYFSVESFDDYGKLSGNTLDHLRSGEGGRVQDEHQRHKRHAADFMLWKPDPSHIMKWDSPWGTGYPGWHIECSTMALDLFGADMIDIHTGGEDLVFPHHECEIAQSRCSTGADHFAKFWMHARFLLVEGRKMSKSKGTIFTVQDVLDGKAGTSNAVHPAVLRYELIRTHYRSNLNFTAKGLADSANAVRKLQSLYGMALVTSAGEAAEIDNSHPVLAAFVGALSDDLNISGAIGEVFKWMGAGAADPSEALAVLTQVDRVLGVLPRGAQEGGGEEAGSLIAAEADVPSEMVELCGQLDTARADKDYAAADELRQKIIDAGFDVQTTKEGTVAKRKLG